VEFGSVDNIRRPISDNHDECPECDVACIGSFMCGEAMFGIKKGPAKRDAWTHRACDCTPPFLGSQRVG